MPTKKSAVVAALVLLAAVGAWAAYRALATKSADQIVWYGNVDVRQVSLAFNAADRIAELSVQEGDRVRAGQVIGRLDTRTLELRAAQARAQLGAQGESLARLKSGSRPEEIAQARARVRSAEAEAQLAAQQLDRLESTSRATEGHGVAKSELDAARARRRSADAQLDTAREAQKLTVQGPRKEDIAQARAQLAAAQAELALMEHQLADAELKSPVDAIVRARLMEPGDMASPQRPVYTLVIAHPKWVRAYATELELPRIRPGQAATVTADGMAQALKGQVGYISSVAEFTPKNVQTEDLRTSLVYEVRVNVDDPDDRLRMGQPVTVRLLR